MRSSGECCVSIFLHNESKVITTGPSIEFSIGTTPNKNSPLSTLSKTAGIVQYEIKLFPKILAASCVNVPLGPKNDIKLI